MAIIVFVNAVLAWRMETKTRCIARHRERFSLVRVLRWVLFIPQKFEKTKGKFLPGAFTEDQSAVISEVPRSVSMKYGRQVFLGVSRKRSKSGAFHTVAL